MSNYFFNDILNSLDLTGTIKLTAISNSIFIDYLIFSILFYFGPKKTSAAISLDYYNYKRQSTAKPKLLFPV